MTQPRFNARDMIETQLRPRGVSDERVLAAMAAVPREAFVRPAQRALAYDDCALPTADGQTISQPYIVGLMTQLLAVAPGMNVLEIGTGAGYQTAVLAHLGGRVTTMERNAALMQSARSRLMAMGVAGAVRFIEGDGTLGCPRNAPYDRILVTAGAPAVPDALQSQTAPGGRIVIPIGTRDSQNLMTFERLDDTWREQKHIPVRFVPLIGEQGWPAG